MEERQAVKFWEYFESRWLGIVCDSYRGNKFACLFGSACVAGKHGAPASCNRTDCVRVPLGGGSS